jgi:hypothetical protein
MYLKKISHIAFLSFVLGLLISSHSASAANGAEDVGDNDKRGTPKILSQKINAHKETIFFLHPAYVMHGNHSSEDDISVLKLNTREGLLTDQDCKLPVTSSQPSCAPTQQDPKEDQKAKTRRVFLQGLKRLQMGGGLPREYMPVTLILALSSVQDLPSGSAADLFLQAKQNGHLTAKFYLLLCSDLGIGERDRDTMFARAAFDNFAQEILSSSQAQTTENTPDLIQAAELLETYYQNKGKVSLPLQEFFKGMAQPIYTSAFDHFDKGDYRASARAFQRVLDNRRLELMDLRDHLFTSPRDLEKAAYALYRAGNLQQSFDLYLKRLNLGVKTYDVMPEIHFKAMLVTFLRLEGFDESYISYSLTRTKKPSNWDRLFSALSFYTHPNHNYLGQAKSLLDNHAKALEASRDTERSTRLRSELNKARSRLAHTNLDVSVGYQF